MFPTRTPLARLLGDLSRDGFTIRLDGERLVVAPASRLTADLREQIREFRADILELLQIHGDGLLKLFAYAEERFKADPLAQKAVELFEAQEVVIQPAPETTTPDHLLLVAGGDRG